MTSPAFATLAGKLASSVDLWIPGSGAWVADVMVATPEALSGQVTLAIGDLSLLGTIIRGGTFAGADSYRIVGGYGGWRKPLPAKSYTHEVGVRFSTVLGDASKAVGETIALAADGNRGPHFVRQSGPASRCFGALGLDWYVSNDGATHTGQRPSGSFAGAFQVLNYDRAGGRTSIATEAPGGLLPGVSVGMPDGSNITAATVIHTVSKGSFRSEVWAA